MKKPVKIVLISFLSLLGTIVLVVGGYAVYVVASYKRIGDMPLEVQAKAKNTTISLEKELTCSTYNIGFGAYSQDYTFFLDSGYDEEGKPRKGYYSTAKSKEEVLFNVNGAINTINDLNVDFALFQEVDVKSNRAYKINQKEMITNSFSEYDNTFAYNYNSKFLPYPIYDMHGAVDAGLVTLSKYSIKEAQRVEYTISDSLSKLIDIDRCFSYSVMDVENGKKLYLVNNHMSAYDKGGTIREKQIQELNDFLQARKDNGDYVIVGGDFNHDLLTYNPNYSYTMDNTPFNNVLKAPDWISYFFNEEKKSPLIDGYSVIASDNSPSCRNNDIEWDANKTYKCTVDGFVVSDNIDIIEHKNIQTKNGNKGLDGFAYSDHEPACIKFKLK